MKVKHTLIVVEGVETYKLDDYPVSVSFNQQTRLIKIGCDDVLTLRAANALGSILTFLSLEHGRKKT
jgi:hypothetical protein